MSPRRLGSAPVHGLPPIQCVQCLYVIACPPVPSPDASLLRCARRAKSAGRPAKGQPVDRGRLFRPAVRRGIPFCLLALGWRLHAAEVGGVALSTTSVAVVYAVMVETGLNRQELRKLILAACVILSAFVPTVIAQQLFKPEVIDVTEEEALGEEDLSIIHRRRTSSPR